MTDRRLAVVWLALLAGCATTASPDDLAARNRPLEERCHVMRTNQSGAQPGQTRADVQAEAQRAYQRGELDKACGWL